MHEALAFCREWQAVRFSALGRAAREPEVYGAACIQKRCLRSLDNAQHDVFAGRAAQHDSRTFKERQQRADRGLVAAGRRGANRRVVQIQAAVDLAFVPRPGVWYTLTDS